MIVVTPLFSIRIWGICRGEKDLDNCSFCFVYKLQLCLFFLFCSLKLSKCVSLKKKKYFYVVPNFKDLQSSEKQWMYTVVKRMDPRARLPGLLDPSSARTSSDPFAGEVTRPACASVSQ